VRGSCPDIIYGRHAVFILLGKGTLPYSFAGNFMHFGIMLIAINLQVCPFLSLNLLFATCADAFENQVDYRTLHPNDWVD
jgi:hypothetical protein